MMKPAHCRLFLIMLLFLCLLLPCAAGADTVSFLDVTADTSATYVDLGDTVIGNKQWNQFYDFLSALPNLEKVDLFSTTIQYDRIEDLHQRFPGIVFGMTMRIQDHILRTDATAFSTLHTVKSQMHGNKYLSLVRYCTNLYALDLGHNLLDDCSFLYDLPELRVLIIGINNIEDITPIASLKHLEYLEIFHDKIRDISCLTGLTHLMDLNVVKNYIEDITPVMEIKSLKRLWIYWYNYRAPKDPDPAIVEQIRQALPDCHVDASSTSTAGGWRRHPHYDVIYRVFHKGVYEPFEDSDPENLPEPWRSERLAALESAGTPESTGD